MEYYLDGKVFKDNDEIYYKLLSIMVPLENDIQGQLVKIFRLTDDNKVRDKIALIFADLSDEHIIPVLINKINEIKYSGHISTLIYVCSEYDCAEWIDFFVGLVIDLDDSSYLEAISVIEGIQKPIKLSDKVICIKRLANYLSSIENESNKYEDVEAVMEFVDNLKTVF
ncbi:hypothetical protein Q4E93_27925 [Flavitalea sp. BT771]|uniref:hypothetical protein n=1 Tax=Flavitalea sp. BT771 TaxID=3063329 RepID=UPI0026E185DC|nr:hypothetical protein [Flavitalea sp. BT771]MDO6434472.1 hypothetical protein [Flavitalea sp. BT771]MDV6223372.1 hypothetical protein [Flavitalea sp. BT771]